MFRSKYYIKNQYTISKMAENKTGAKVECSVDWDRLQKSMGDEFCQRECITEELSGGESNFVYRITSKTGSSVIVKQSLGYFKCVGPELPMPDWRNQIEYSTLSLLNEVAPGSVPEPIFSDEDKFYYVMQDLWDYSILRQKLQRHQASIQAIQDVARYIAKLHRSTHKNEVSEVSLTKMAERTKNDAFQGIILYYIFEDMHSESNIERHSPALKEIYDVVNTDPLIVMNRETIRTIMTTKQECLIHGDLHTSSILIKGDSAKIIDFETSHVGPAGEDIGHLLANYTVAYLEHKFYPSNDNPAFHSLLQECIKETVHLYFTDAAEYLTPKQFAATVSDTAGFTGCRLVRRIFGRPEEGDRKDRAKIELPCLHIGVRLTQDYNKITTPSDLIKYIFDNNDMQINNEHNK